MKAVSVSLVVDGIASHEVPVALQPLGLPTLRRLPCHRTGFDHQLVEVLPVELVFSYAGARVVGDADVDNPVVVVAEGVTMDVLVEYS